MNHLMKYFNYSQSSQLSEKVKNEAEFIDDDDLRCELQEISEDLKGKDGYLSNIVDQNLYSDDSIEILEESASELNY